MNNRSRGARGERAFALAIGGKKISRTGYPGPDVEGPDGVLYEVKIVKKFPVWLKKFLDQVEREGADALAMKEDRGEWLVLRKIP